MRCLALLGTLNGPHALEKEREREREKERERESERERERARQRERERIQGIPGWLGRMPAEP